MKQLRAAKVPQLKNHIAPKGKLLTQVLDRKFGVSLADFDRAMGGDIQAAQKIGEPEVLNVRKRLKKSTII